MKSFAPQSITQQKADYVRRLRLAQSHARRKAAEHFSGRREQAVILTDQANSLIEMMGQLEDRAANKADKMWPNWRSGRPPSQSMADRKRFKSASRYVLRASAQVRSRHTSLLSQAKKVTAPYRAALAALDRKFARLMKTL